MTDQPDVLVTATRYTVSVLPDDDINRRYFEVYIELTPRGWAVHDGHAGYDDGAGEHVGETHRHPLADYQDALDLARWLAPRLTVNGRTAVDAYRRTHAA